MLIDIKLEQIPGGAAETKIVKVYKKEGDKVKSGEALFDIEAGKSSTTIECTVPGKINSITILEGNTAKLGQILAVVEGNYANSENTTSNSQFDYMGNLMKPKKQALECDIAIIGGGPGGYVAAIQAAKLGAEVVLVEKEAIGGTCLNRGCIPTKALVRSAEIFRNLKNAESFGCYAENIRVDIKKVIDRKDKIVRQLVQGIHYLLKKHKVKVVKGIGEVQDKNTVFVKSSLEETIIKSENIILATGSKSSSLPIPGSDSKNVINSTHALELDMLPEKMVIVGGGVIGMEFAFIFNSFGVEVTVIEYLSDILMNCDIDVCHEIYQSAKRKGINIHTGSKVEEIINTEDGKCIVSFTENDEKKYIAGDKVLMAVGRVPSMNGVNAEKLQIELNDRGRGIKVNDRMQTNIPNIYSIGDVTNKIQLAHVASHQGITAVKNIMGKRCEMDYSAVPYAIFTEPEVAMVGICEKTAEKQGISIEVGKFPFAANGKALTAGETEGFVKIIKDTATGKVIGGTIVGPHATDLLTEIVLAVKNQLTTEQITESIHSHPTTSEAIHEAALDVEGGSIHFAQ